MRFTTAPLRPTRFKPSTAAGSAGKCTTPAAPFIVSQPASQTVTAGNNATFTVGAGGTPPLSYQWRFNSNDLTGETGVSLTLTNVQIANAGNYSVVVSNGLGAVTSSNALLTVNLPPASVRVLGTNAMAGSRIEVPVVLVANGTENALSFSLGFNPQRLAFTGITLGSGASGASLLTNISLVGSGRLGIAVGLDAGLAFAAGTREIVRVAFTTSMLGGTQPVNTPVTITNQPINKLLTDVSAHPLVASYLNGLVTLSPSELEGDAFPRAGGNRVLDISDWVQVGRYVAGLDTVSNANEFQRVDCAPRAMRGDGILKVTDWVQAGRYAAGLDPLTTVGGPDAPIVLRSLARGPSVQGGNESRTVQIADGEVVNGLTVTLPVVLQSLGNEFGLGFSLSFDPAVLHYVGVVKGSAAAAATLNTNTIDAAAGKVGIVMTLPAGNTFVAGSQEIVRVTFSAQTSVPGNYPVVLGDQPVWRAVSDATAEELTASYVNNQVVVHASPALAIAPAGTNVILSWPSWAGDFTLQAADTLSGAATNWSNPAWVVQTNGATVSATAPASALTRFFRLFHP
ncbi:MAG: cohesin domain-containing protein [Verrucomicrobiota bacterium]